MCLLKRIVAVLLGLLSVVAFVLCFAGVVSVWVIKQPVEETAHRLLARASRALEVTTRTLAQVHTSLQEARTDLQTIKESSPSPNTRRKKPGFFDDLMVRGLLQQLGSNIGQVRDTVIGVTEASIVANSLLEGVQQFPGASLGTLDTDRLKQIQQSLDRMTQKTRELGDMLKQPAPGLNDPRAAETTSEISETLDQTIAAVGRFQDRAAHFQATVADLKAQSESWIQLAPWVITGVLLWVAATQLSMVWLVRSWLKRRGV